MTRKNVESFLSNLISKMITEIQISTSTTSEEPKVGTSGTSVYADHNHIVKIVKKDKEQLKKIFSETKSAMEKE